MAGVDEFGSCASPMQHSSCPQTNTPCAVFASDQISVLRDETFSSCHENYFTYSSKCYWVSLLPSITRRHASHEGALPAPISASREMHTLFHPLASPSPTLRLDKSLVCGGLLWLGFRLVGIATKAKMSITMAQEKDPNLTEAETKIHR